MLMKEHCPGVIPTGALATREISEYTGVIYS